MKVLIVDDSPMTLALAQARLRDENLDVSCASGGVEGLVKAKKERPDLILLDLKMPDLSGYEVCEQLKSDPLLSAIPVIFLTAADSTEDKVKGLDMGAVDYVAKPFDPVELCARVRAALRVKRLQDLLNLRAQLDPLTELWNRQAMQDRLRQEWARMSRHEEALSFVMMDIDHFKRVNDTFGHPAGDRVLCAVSQVLTAQCRESDMPCRYGGEEFAVILPDVNSTAAAHFAERCREEIEKISLSAQSRVIHVTASFGVADSRDLHAREELIHRADEALYRAKHAGRNRVVLWECNEWASDYVREGQS
ncbi:MAG: diguanylate cyclase [Phycisphaerae bacterium]|nr:diguanylate cyclase [Phycisphaerae bacterium]